MANGDGFIAESMVAEVNIPAIPANLLGERSSTLNNHHTCIYIKLFMQIIFYINRYSFVNCC